jgi:hypothetical protein
MNGGLLNLTSAMHVKAAEFWLKLGLPIQALLELEELPRRARRHPWAIRMYVAAMDRARSYHRQSKRSSQADALKGRGGAK